MRRFLPLFALLFIIAVCSALGNWQLNRADYKRGLQAARDKANELAALDADAIQNLDGQVDGRRIRVRGRWLADKTVFLDNRTHDGRAGFHVITPIKLTRTGKTVLILRGWVMANPRNRTAIPKVAASKDVVELIGYGQSELGQSLQLSSEPEPGPEQKIWQYFDYEKFDRWSGTNVMRMIVRQTSETPDQLVRDWPVAGNDVDRHLGYAFQWFAMALAALIFLLWQLLKPGRKAANTR